MNASQILDARRAAYRDALRGHGQSATVAKENREATTRDMRAWLEGRQQAATPSVERKSASLLSILATAFQRATGRAA